MDSMEVEELVERFQYFEDWQERYRYLISLGSKLPPLAEEAKIEANKVEGCLSKVWLVIDHADADAIHFAADSDSVGIRQRNEMKSSSTTFFALFSIDRKSTIAF